MKLQKRGNEVRPKGGGKEPTAEGHMGKGEWAESRAGIATTGTMAGRPGLLCQWEGPYRGAAVTKIILAPSHLSCAALCCESPESAAAVCPGSLLWLSTIRPLHGSLLCLSAMGFLLWPLYHGSLS